ncbi:hypothetical protein BDR03DRAFT_278487 [Suillus americanus]|nr:hypothetical protein BDR03DRAFT_278487 [Suillus americanus]
MLESQCTFFVESPRIAMPRNHILARMASMSGNQETVSGSILIVKQTRSVENAALMNITKDEIVLINFLLNRREFIVRQPISTMELGL